MFAAQVLERFADAQRGGRIVHCALSIVDSILSLADSDIEYGNESPENLKGSPVLLTILTASGGSVVTSDRARRSALGSSFRAAPAALVDQGKGASRNLGPREQAWRREPSRSDLPSHGRGAFTGRGASRPPAPAVPSVLEILPAPWSSTRKRVNNFQGKKEAPISKMKIGA